jgi:hypothetical protein
LSQCSSQKDDPRSHQTEGSQDGQALNVLQAQFHQTEYYYDDIKAVPLVFEVF